MSSSRQVELVPGAPRIAYETAGPSNQPTPLIFLHGIGGHRGNWRRQLDAFADQHRVVAWDARGYGASDDYDGDLDFAAFATDLERLLDHLGCTRAHLCGLSMGGRIILDFHDRHAERIESLILVDTFPGFDSSFTQEGRERFVRERRQPLIEGKEPADIAPIVAPTLVGPNASQAIIDELSDSMSRLHKDSYIKTVQSMTMYQPVADLSRVQVPVQIIVGRDDKLTPVKVSEQMANDIAHARLSIIEDCGHLSNIEQPTAFNKILRTFLQTFPG